jgi:hypothetical protein
MKAMLRCGFFTVNRIRVQSIFCALQVAIAQLPTALLSKKFAPKKQLTILFFTTCKRAENYQNSLRFAAVRFQTAASISLGKWASLILGDARCLREATSPGLRFSRPADQNREIGV